MCVCVCVWGGWGDGGGVSGGAFCCCFSSLLETGLCPDNSENPIILLWLHCVNKFNHAIPVAYLFSQS